MTQANISGVEFTLDGKFTYPGRVAKWGLLGIL